MDIFLTIWWHVFCGGWATAISCYISGAFCCLTIIFIPVGIASFKLGYYLFAPFTSRMIKKSTLAKLTGRNISEQKKWYSIFTPIANTLWAILFGWWLTAVYAICGVLCYISIVEIPFGIILFRLLKAGIPFTIIGYTIITEDEYKRLVEKTN